MTRVVIVQEYVPHYRAPLFNQMVESGRARGIEIVIAAGKPSGTLAARSDGVHVSGERSISQLELNLAGRRLTMRRLARVLSDADFVVLEQARRNLDAYMLLGRRRRRFPVALWGHGRDYTQDVGALSERLRLWMTSRADWFFAYTEGGKKAVVAEGYPRERVTVLENAVDTSELSEGVTGLTEDEKAEFAGQYGLTDATALYIGGLDESKRLDFLLESAVAVHAKVPEFRLLIAGSGERESDVAAFAANHSWCVYLGQVHGKRKWTALALSQALLVPGRVGLVAVDSFAAGVPIVTTDWPWHAPEFEYLIPDVNAIVTGNSIDMYADGVLRILTDHSMRERLKQDTLGYAGTYSVEKMAERYIDGIEEWIRGTGVPSGVQDGEDRE
ncbi:Glycosyltransferase involved in cell wall bisynthesis [Microbacterium testaceum StLB037]|uniref:Glycosyltransferase involved in cell wall bisynthesis n=1 Tax=Microbacterium testaceum (strain StLB037) TaxID=979556 RepID=A0A1H0S5F4_MICTS|nr:glycosyltransferase family 4 protein [Microbacterium testaceum]SDP36488.1 Glycosyltransferase involved in cell wall bisynthesis [Microbacterium testaceum StLB037]